MKKLIIIFIAFAVLSCSSKTVEPVQASEPDEAITIQLKKETDTVLNPISTMLLVDAGLAKANGEMNKAIEFYKAAIQVDSNNDAAHFELAHIYKEMEEPDIESALDHAQSAYAIDDQNTWYKLFYGRLLVDSGQTEEGIAMFKELKNQHPKDIEFKYDLAFAYEQAGLYKEALEVYDNIEELYGFDPEINFQRHNIYFALEEIEKAIAEIEEISDRHPEYVTYSAYLANYYYEQGNLSKALKFADSVLAQNKNDLQTNIIAAKIYTAKENKVKVKNHLQKVVRSETMTIDQKVNALLPFIELQQTFPSVADTIIKSVSELQQQYPQNAKAYALYGDFLTHNDQTQQAINAYKNSLEYDQSVYMVWKQLLSLYSSLDRNEEIAQYGAQMETHFKEDFFAFYMTGYSNYRLGVAEKAVKSLSKALELTENKEYILELHSLLGDAYNQLGEFEQSNLHYDKALLISPDNEYVLNNYSYHLAERKESLEKAFLMARRAYELNPNDANTIDTLAWVLFQQGKYEEALTMFEEAYDLHDNSAVITEHLGDAHFKSGNKSKALHYWNKALMLNSASEILHQKIEQEQFIPKQ